MATRKSSSSSSKSKQKTAKAAALKPKVSALKSAKTEKSPKQLAVESLDILSPAKNVSVAASSSPKQKIKLVRDSFTIPKNEYIALSDLKLRSIRMGRPAKKSEVLRAGIAALSKMTDAAFSAALDAIPSLKTGRPKESKKATVEKSSGIKKN